MCDALEKRPQSSGTVQVPQPFTEFFDDAIAIFHNWGTYLYSARTDKHGLHSLLSFIDTAVSADIDTISTYVAIGSVCYSTCPPSCLYCDDMHKCYGMSLALDDNKSVVTLCKQGGKRWSTLLMFPNALVAAPVLKPAALMCSAWIRSNPCCLPAWPNVRQVLSITTEKDPPNSVYCTVGGLLRMKWDKLLPKGRSCPWGRR